MDSETLKQKIKLYGQARVARVAQLNPMTVNKFIHSKDKTRESTIKELKIAVKNIEKVLPKQ